MNRRPRLDDFTRNFEYEDDRIQSPSTSQRHVRPEEISIEMEGRESDVPNQNKSHTLPRAIIDQLPSRNKTEMFGRENCRRRNVASKFGTLHARVAPSLINQLNTQEVLNLLKRETVTDTETVDEIEKKQGETLRELHYALTWKRSIKKKLGKDNKRRKTKQLGFFKQIKYNLSMKWLKLKTGAKEALFSLELWKGTLRSIEGNFGSSVASYFYLLRSLLRLNFLSCFIFFIFIVVPQILYNHITKIEHSDLPCNITQERDQTNQVQVKTYPDFSPEVLITGGEWFEGTIMYYGSYSSEIFSIIDGAYYNIPLAYLLAVSANMIIVLILMATALARSFSKRYIFQKGLKTNLFFNKTFCGWDFAIMNEKAARQQKESLQKDLKEYLSQLNKNVVNYTFKKKIISFLRFLFFHAIAIALLVGTGALIYYLLEKKSLETQDKFLSQMGLSLTVVAITVIVPTVLAFIVEYEGYRTARTKLWVTMIRSILLIAVILAILFFFWVLKEKDNNMSCWETKVGTEIYRLMIMDFLVCGVLDFFGFWLRRIVHTNCKKISKRKFNVAWNTWILLYNQMLFWIGTILSPLLAVVIIIKMVIIFYTKLYSVKLHSKRSQRSQVSANAQIIFFSATFLGLILSMITIGIIVIYAPSSSSCGPFRTVKFPYNVILCVTKSFSTYQQTIGEVFAFITRPGCVSLFVIFMCCAAYYSRAVSAGALKMVNLIRHQVTMEGKDKSFLISRLSPILKASMQPNANGDECSSLPPSPRKKTSDIVETANFDVASDESEYNSARNSRSSNDYSRRFEFSKKMATPIQHKNFSENSPLSSNRRRQMSVPTDSENDRSDIELSPYRSNDSLPAYPYLNQGFKGDSPLKSDLSSPYHETGSPLPGVRHQPPFRNFCPNRERIKSDENIKSNKNKRDRR